MHDPERNGVGLALVTNDQLAKGVGVTTTRVFDELSIVRRQAPLRFTLVSLDEQSAQIIQRKLCKDQRKGGATKKEKKKGG
jgi:hypothetical protein